MALFMPTLIIYYGTLGTEPLKVLKSKKEIKREEIRGRLDGTRYVVPDMRTNSIVWMLI
jgi:hypothetical protein